MNTLIHTDKGFCIISTVRKHLSCFEPQGFKLFSHIIPHLSVSFPCVRNEAAKNVVSEVFGSSAHIQKEERREKRVSGVRLGYSVFNSQISAFFYVT